jgi:hypothetical protein
MKRVRFEEILSSPDRLSKKAARLQAELKAQPRGRGADKISGEAAQPAADADLVKWASSRGLQPPK